MAKTILNGYYIAASASSETLHSNAGKLLGILASHTSTSTQTVTFYDATAATGGTEMLVLNVAPGQSPAYILFERHIAPGFSTGLHVDPGSCDVLIWSVDNG